MSRFGVDLSSRFGEIYIPRIKFKPGYQRLWRLARSSIKEALNLNYTYQYRLTRYLSRFGRRLNSFLINFTEMSLERTIMYSLLLPDPATLKIFITSRLIFLNGTVVFNTGKLVYPNDIIQVTITKFFYIFNRWLTNYTITRISKFKRLVHRKSLWTKGKLMKNRKVRSRHTPTWIFNTRYDRSDVKPYLEVDYFTLSAFFIYEPFIINQQKINELPEYRQNTYRLYNWKYIN